MSDFNFKKAGSKRYCEPRSIGSILEEMLNGNTPLAVDYRQFVSKLKSGKNKK